MCKGIPSSGRRYRQAGQRGKSLGFVGGSRFAWGEKGCQRPSCLAFVGARSFLAPSSSRMTLLQVSQIASSSILRCAGDALCVARWRNNLRDGRVRTHTVIAFCCTMRAALQTYSSLYTGALVLHAMAAIDTRFSLLPRFSHSESSHKTGIWHRRRLTSFECDAANFPEGSTIQPPSKIHDTPP